MAQYSSKFRLVLRLNLLSVSASENINQLTGNQYARK